MFLAGGTARAKAWKVRHRGHETVRQKGPQGCAGPGSACHAAGAL